MNCTHNNTDHDCVGLFGEGITFYLEINKFLSYQSDISIRKCCAIVIFHTVVKLCLEKHLGVFAGDADLITN